MGAETLGSHCKCMGVTWALDALVACFALSAVALASAMATGSGGGAVSGKFTVRPRGPALSSYFRAA